MASPLPGFWGFADQISRLTKGHSHRSPNSSEYLTDVPAALKTFVSRKLTVEEAIFLVSRGYDVSVNVHGDPIASERGAQHFVDAVRLLERIKGE